MRGPVITRRAATIGLIGAAAAANGAFAQDYPNRPIKLIVPVPPGSGVDAVSRNIGQRMSRSMGVPVVLEHKPGAGAIVGTEALAKSPPDGYTIMMGYTAHGTNPQFVPSLPYDTEKDFTPIIYVCYIPAVLLVHPSLPVNSVQELIAHIKKNPGNYSYASGGVGATAHLCGELLKYKAGLDLQHVPYKGNAPALNDLLGGHVTLMFDIISTALPQVQAGKLKALAITSAKRAKDLPNVPTIIESGLADFEVVGWYMMLAPAGVPPAIVTRLNKEADEALRDPAVRDVLTGQGFEIVGGSAQDADKFLRGEMKRWAEVVAATGIKAR